MIVGSRMSNYFCALVISKYVIRLCLSRLLSNMTIGSNFLLKHIFVSEYISERSVVVKFCSRSRLKNFGVDP